MESIFGSFVFEFIGAVAKWLYYVIHNSILGEEPISFKEIYRGKRRSKNVDKMTNAMSNVGLGIVVVFLICTILIWLGV